MKHLSSVLLFAVLVKLASSKISNAVPSFSKAYNNQRVSQARPVRDAPFRIGEPVYMTIDELQHGASAYDYPQQQWQPYSDYRDASPRSCGLKKQQVQVQPVHIQPVQIQPVYYPVPVKPVEYHQVAIPHTEYETITVPHTEYHQVTVPHTEYQHVSVPVQHSYQAYPVKKPCYKSADGAAINPVELPTVNGPAKSAEFADPAMQDSALYQAIAKPLTSMYKEADINRNAQYQADAYQRSMVAPEMTYNPYHDTAKSAELYQANLQAPEFGRQAQYLPNGKAAYAQGYQAAIPEMRAAIAPEMLTAATPEGRAAQVYQTADFGRNAMYQADGRFANADMNQRAAITPELSHAAFADMNQRAAIAPELSRAALADMNQRAAIAPELSRAALADWNQRSAIAPELNRAALADWNQRSAIVPELSRAAYADMNQKAAIVPEVNQRSAIAPEWWSRNAMYQPDGSSVYADSYQRAAITPSAYADVYQRNAFVPEYGHVAGQYPRQPLVSRSRPEDAYKSAAMEKAPLASEGKPIPAAPHKQSAPESSQKGKSESPAHHE